MGQLLHKELRHILVRAETLCHQAIFVDDATRVVAPPDPEVIEVGDGIWHGGESGAAWFRVRCGRCVL